MKLPKINKVYVNYIESGCFAGGEEACYDAGIKTDETCVVLKEKDYKALIGALKILREDTSGDLDFIKYSIKKLFNQHEINK